MFYHLVISNMGFRILDFLGYTGSDYDWIQREIDREKEDEEYERREREESIKVCIHLFKMNYSINNKRNKLS